MSEDEKFLRAWYDTLVEAGWIKGYTLHGIDESGRAEITVDLHEPIKFITLSADINLENPTAA